MKSNRINLITIAVEDLDRAQSYYEALGWQISERTDGIAFFNLSGQKLGLYKRAMLEKDIGEKIAPSTGNVTLAQNFNSPADVDAWHQRALSAGALEVVKPETTFWGGYSGYHKDLDGHLWEFAHNPFWTLDEEGLII